MSRRRAVITGLGPITCIGHGRENFWNAILAEKSGIKSFDSGVFRVRAAGEINDWDPEQFFSPQRLKRLDRYAQFAVVSAKMALEDAQFEIPAKNHRIASVLASAPRLAAFARPKNSISGI